MGVCWTRLSSFFVMLIMKSCSTTPKPLSKHLWLILTDIYPKELRGLHGEGYYGREEGYFWIRIRILHSQKLPGKHPNSFLLDIHWRDNFGEDGWRIVQKGGIFRNAGNLIMFSDPKNPSVSFFAHSDKYLTKRAFWSAWREGIMGGYRFIFKFEYRIRNQRLKKSPCKLPNAFL